MGPVELMNRQLLATLISRSPMNTTCRDRQLATVLRVKENMQIKSTASSGALETATDAGLSLSIAPADEGCFPHSGNPVSPHQLHLSCAVIFALYHLLQQVHTFFKSIAIAFGNK